MKTFIDNINTNYSFYIVTKYKNSNFVKSNVIEITTL